MLFTHSVPLSFLNPSGAQLQSSTCSGQEAAGGPFGPLRGLTIHVLKTSASIRRRAQEIAVLWYIKHSNGKSPLSLSF